MMPHIPIPKKTSHHCPCNGILSLKTPIFPSYKQPKLTGRSFAKRPKINIVNMTTVINWKKTTKHKIKNKNKKSKRAPNRACCHYPIRPIQWKKQFNGSNPRLPTSQTINTNLKSALLLSPRRKFGNPQKPNWGIELENSYHIIK